MKEKENFEVDRDAHDGDEENMQNESRKAGKLTFQDIRDHMSGPVVSLMVHIILIALLSAVIVIKGPEDEGEEIQVDILEVEFKKPMEIPDPPPEFKPEDPITDLPNDPLKPSVEDPDVPPVDSVFDPVLQPVDVPPIKITLSALKMPVSGPTSMSLRDPKNRREILKIYPPVDGEKGQNALLKGLRWLKDHQNPDGSWGDVDKGNVPAYTGLALLAFLGHGDTPSSAEFGSTVLKGIKKLIEFSGNEGMGVKGGYRHGIVMYALSEAFAMTRIPMLENVVEKGTDRIIKAQNDRGSFNYGYDNSKMRCDLSVAGWNYQALKAAFAAGCKSSGLVQAIDKSSDIGLKKTHQVSSGGFSYADSGGAKGSMTSVGVLCLQLFGDIKSNEVKRGVSILEGPNQFWFSWKGKDNKVPAWALYQWYYQTQVFFQAYEGKGNKWRKWDKMFSRELIKQQKTDGRWVSPGFEYGSKEAHGEAMLKGLDQPVYSTSLCCLMLEVYYRYMTTSAARNVKKLASKKVIDEDDDLGLKMQ